MSQIELSSKDKTAVKELIVSLNTRYGSKSEIGKIDWKKGTFTTPGAATPSRKFELSDGARPGTFRVKVAGQSGVTKPKAVKK